MTINYLILLLPLVCTGFEYHGITIQIEVAPTEFDVAFEPYGEDIKTATDSDLAAFGLTNDKLADAVALNSSGTRATNIFTRSPTPWNDLYKRYEWPEVRREIQIEDLKLVNVTIEKRIIAEREYTNVYSDTELEMTGKLRTFAYNDFLIDHHWSGNGKVSGSVLYMFLRPFLPYPLEYQSLSKVGESRSQAGIQIVGLTDIRATFKLKPKQKAKMCLEATTVVTRVSVLYETFLKGAVLANFENAYKGHHFYPYSVNRLLRLVKLPTKVFSKDFVTINNIKDFHIQVVDAKTGNDIEFTSKI